MRSETEWVEILREKAAVLTDADPKKMINGFHQFKDWKHPHFPSIFGDGNAAFEIIDHLLANL